MENVQVKVVCTTRDELVSREVTMGGTRVNDWSISVLPHSGDKSQYPCSLLAYPSVPG